MGMWASVNGVLTPAAEARVSVMDTGFAWGDSVYETLRTYGGRPHALSRHLRRLRASADRLAIALLPSDADFAQRIDDVLRAAGNDESYIRLVVSRGVGDLSYAFDRIVGPTVVVVVKPYAPLPSSAYAEGVRAALVSVRRNSPRALDPAIKSGNLLNNVLAVREAQARGAVEAILLNERGEVAEGASSNVFAIRAGVVLTPPPTAGLLEGVTRALVLEAAATLGIPAREVTLTADDLRTADELFITSTLKELAPVSRLDGTVIGGGRAGALTLRLLTAYRQAAAAGVA